MGESDSQLTPEKRLLQLIEGGQEESAAKSSSAHGAGFVQKLQQAMSPEGMKALIEEVKENWLTAIKNRKDFINLHGVNRAGKVLTAILGIYLILNLFYDIKIGNSNYISNLEIPQKEMADIAMSDRKIFKTDVLQDETRLKVFLPLSKRKLEKAEEKQDEMSLKLVAMIKNWKLAGISIFPADPGRTFCMIEDLEKSTTTFLRVGDTLSGLKVDKIEPDSVLFRFNEETIELR